MSLERAFDGLRGLELTDAEVDAVLARVERRRGRPSRLAVAFACLALSGALAVAATAGRGGLSNAFARFFAGGAPPGDPVPASELPGVLRRAAGGSPVTLVAEADGQRLLAFHDRGDRGVVCFEYGGVGECTPNGADAFFDGEPVRLFGPAHRDSAGRWILFGVALTSVERVALHYDSGPPTVVRVGTGFAVPADPDRTPTTLVALAADGETVGSLDVRQRFRLAPIGG
jgi:hypothetical protein